MIVKGTERVSFGYLDPRVAWGTGTPHYWHTIWMAVSCCCGLQGEALPVRLPDPSPKVIH